MRKFLKYALKVAVLCLFLAGIWNTGGAEAFHGQMFQGAQQRGLLQQNFLRSTLGGSIGMQGFEGAYALNDPQEIVEIIVQFVTPPFVALRLGQGSGSPSARMLSGDSFEAQALTAHDAFQQQLSQLPMPFGVEQQIEIFGEQSALFNGVYMRLPAGMVSSISALPEVFAVFPNLVISIDVPPFVSPSSLAPMSFPHNNAARTLFNIDQIHNTLGFTGDGVVVAVLDTGIDGNHPDLMRYRDPATNRIRGWNFINNNNNVGDPHGHGTHVSGTVVAMAPDVELWHYRILDAAGQGRTSWLMDAIEQAWSDGADIINLSLGPAGTPNVSDPVSYMLNLVALDGVIPVVAAGNNPSTISSYGTASLPIVVGAGTDGGIGQLLDTIASFSSRGPVPHTFHIKPDIIAPGVGIHSTWPGGGYRETEGTSMAVPAVAGIAALMLEAFPNAEPYEIKARIMSSARPLADFTTSTVFTVGAGFIYPIEALTATGFITVEHEVIWGTGMDFETHTMSSFSFGSLGSALQSGTGTIPGMIHNTTGLPRTFTIGHNFTNNPGNAAKITLSRTSIDIGPHQTGNFAATISFSGNVQGGAGAAGFYDGYIYVADGGVRVAQLPFGLVNPTTINVPAHVLSVNLGTGTSPNVPASIAPINVGAGANILDFITNHHPGFTHRYGGFPLNGPLNGPTRDGYLFLGWFTDSAFGTPLTPTTTMTGDTTLYARWDDLTGVAPVIHSHPQSLTIDQRGNQSKTASFSVTATGEAPMTYQWQRSDDGVTWNNIGANTATYSLAVQAADDGAQFRVVVNNPITSAVSNPATLTVTITERESGMLQRLRITEQPQSLRVNLGDIASFSVTASGAAYFQWQRMLNGRWRDISDANADTYSFVAQAADSGTLFRVLARDGRGGEVISSSATLAVNLGADGGASTSGGSSGCNAAGVGLIAFAFVGAAAFITKKKK